MFIKNLVLFSKDFTSQFFNILIQIIQDALRSGKNLFLFTLWTALSIAAVSLFLGFFNLYSIMTTLLVISNMHFMLTFRGLSIPYLEQNAFHNSMGKRVAYAFFKSAQFTLGCLLTAGFLSTLFFQPGIGLTTPLFFCVYALFICATYRYKSNFTLYGFFRYDILPICNNSNALFKKFIFASGLILFGPLSITAVYGILGYLFISIVTCISAQISFPFAYDKTARLPILLDKKEFATIEDRSAYTLQKYLRRLIHLKKARKKVYDPKNHSEDLLESLQNKLEKISNGHFTVTPPEPRKAPSLDSLGLDEYAEQMPCDSQGKQIVRKFLNNIQYISTQKFDVHLRNSIVQFNAYLNTHRIDDYVVFLLPQTSTQWVFERSLRYLEQLPSKIYRDYSKNTINSALNKKPGPKTVVIFDDWSITATQIRSRIYSLAENHKQLHIILVIPYLTMGAARSINRLNQEFLHYQNPSQSMNVTVCTSGLLNTLNLMLPPQSDPNKPIIDSIIKNGLTYYNNYSYEIMKTLIYSDWKKPDSISNYLHLYHRTLPIPEVRPCYKP